MVDGLLNKKVGCVIQARMASTRLPGKVLMPLPFLGQTSILAHICNQLKLTAGRVIVATSVNEENDPIEELCSRLEVECFRGSEHDVFSRFLMIQKNHQFEHILRFTADNPLIDLQKLSAFFQKYLASNTDYAYSSGMPVGMNFEAFKGNSLLEASNTIETKEEKEHVTLHMKRSNRFSQEVINIAQFDHCRATVDTPIDYAQLSLLYQVSQHHKLEKGLGLLSYVQKEHPWILTLNEGVLQNNSSNEPEKELEVIAKLAAAKGYHHAVQKLLD